jgi:hypothetical protein
MSDYVPAVGDRFDLPSEGIHGVIDSVVKDDFDEPASLVIRMDSGKWASVALDAIQFIPATLH